MSSLGGRPRRRLVIIGGSVLLVGIVIWLLARPHAAANDGEATAPPLVSVMVPAIGDVSATVSLTGLISARNDMPIGNEGDPGRIAAVLVEAITCTKGNSSRN